MAPATRIGCRCVPLASRPPALSPAPTPAPAQTGGGPALRAGRAVTGGGGGRGARPAAGGRGERRLALLTLRLRSALGLARSGTRMVPLVAILSAPAAS